MHADCDVSFGGARFECVDTGLLARRTGGCCGAAGGYISCRAGKGTDIRACYIHTFKGVHYEMIVQCGDYEWMIQDTTMREVGAEVAFCAALRYPTLRKIRCKALFRMRYMKRIPGGNGGRYEEQ